MKKIRVDGGETWVRFPVMYLIYHWQITVFNMSNPTGCTFFFLVTCPSLFCDRGDDGKCQENSIANRCAGATFALVLKPSSSSWGLSQFVIEYTLIRKARESATINTESDPSFGLGDDIQGSSGSSDVRLSQVLGSGVVYLEDLDTLVVQWVVIHTDIFILSHVFVRELPGTCEVMDEDAQDDFLRAGYANLPPLRYEQAVWPYYKFVTHASLVRGPFVLGTQQKVRAIPCFQGIGWQWTVAFAYGRHLLSFSYVDVLIRVGIVWTLFNSFNLVV